MVVMKINVACSECTNPLIRYIRDCKSSANFFCNLSCKALWQKRAKPVSRGWLAERYIKQKLDCTEIGKLVDRDPKSVWNWLKDFGIKTRKRGTNPNVGFKKGQPSAFKGRKQKRGPDSPHWKGGITAQRQAFYASDEWKAVCKIVYGRAHARCERCGNDRGNEHRLGRKLHIHHITPFEVVEMRSNPDNLMVLCRPCHLFVHSNANANGEFLAIPISTRRLKYGRPPKNAVCDGSSIGKGLASMEC